MCISAHSLHFNLYISDIRREDKILDQIVIGFSGSDCAHLFFLRFPIILTSDIFKLFVGYLYVMNQNEKIKSHLPGTS